MNKLSYIILAIVIVFFSCKKKESTVHPIGNDDFRIGDINENSSDISDIVISVFPHIADGMYYETNLHGLSIYKDYKSELFFEVGVSGGYSSYSCFCYCRTVDNWEICLQENDSLKINLLDVGDTLSLQNNWGELNSNYYVFSTYTYYDVSPNTVIDSSGMWNNMEDGYMGLRFIEQTDTIYGWVRLGIQSHYEMTIKEYSVSRN